MVYVLAVLAAALFGAGASIQQRVAATAPDEAVLHLRLLWYLIRQRLWLLGLGTTVVGTVFSAAAVGIGGVALVQPLLVTRLVFALPISARWNRRSLHRREWFGALAVLLGLAGFVAAGRPSPGGTTTVAAEEGDVRWAMAAGAVLVLTGALVVIARRLRSRSEAPVLAAGAGMTFALQSALTTVVVHGFHRYGLLAALSSWPVYGAGGAAVLGTLLAQSAYKLAPLPASYPPLAVAEPLAGIALGLTLLGSTLRLTPLAIAVGALGLILMTVGVYVLASSPLVTAAHHRTGPPTPDDATVEAHEEERR